MAALLCAAGPAAAQAPCSNLNGAARTNCLNALQAQQRAQQQAQQAAQQQAAQRAAQQAAQQAAALKAQQAQQQAAQQQAEQQAATAKSAPTQPTPLLVPVAPAKASTTPSFNTAQTTPMTATKSTASVTSPAKTAVASSGVVWSSPDLGFTPKNPTNCVLFLSQDLHISFPKNKDLTYYPAKTNIINFHGTPQRGDIAIIQVTTGPDVAYGHVAEVTNVTSNSITILEAGWLPGGGVDSRVVTETTLQAAEQKINIVGFYRP